MYTTWLPYPVSANRNARIGKRGVYKSAVARGYQATVRAIFEGTAGVGSGGAGKTLIEPHRPVEVSMIIHPPMPKSWKVSDAGQRRARCIDVGNAEKLILDAGNGVLWRDDGQIKHLLVVKEDSNPIEGGGVWFMCRELQ